MIDRIAAGHQSEVDGVDRERLGLPPTAVYGGETLTDARDRALATAYHGLSSTRSLDTSAAMTEKPGMTAP